ncbi:hypothetical protein KAS42_00255 [bacterium]|nr:hypothetical protein [bacterium]
MRDRDKEIKDMSLVELAFYVSDHLHKNGIEAVLTGGACVSIYSNNAYLSYDLDFVIQRYKNKVNARDVLAEIGFFEKSQSFYHKETDYFIEFVPGPLAVGSEPVKDISELKRRAWKLKLLSPTECVKDRLAAFYHWNDMQSLEQALLVAKKHKIDLGEIGRWSKNEMMESKFAEFKKLLK